MLTSATKSQKTSGGLGYLRLNNSKNGEIRIGVGLDTLYLVPRDFQRQDRGSTRFKKWSQYNKPDLFLLARLRVQATNVWAQKIDGTTLETYRIIVPIFSVSDKDDMERFFEKTFSLTDFKPDIVFGMLLLTINNANIHFQAWDL